MDLPLFDVDRSWQVEFGHMVGANEWLQKKLDRARRLRQHHDYLLRYMGELTARHVSNDWVLDLGPGAGELLEIVRHWCYRPIGLDAPDGRGGMGDEYMKACRMLHERQKLQVLYCGLNELLHDYAAVKPNAILSHKGEYYFVNSRGSIEQMFADCMDGPPHDEHHDCKLLSWVDCDSTVEKVQNFMRLMSELLQPGGALLIHMNGAENTEVGSGLFVCAGQENGLEIVRQEDERLLKWRKPIHANEQPTGDVGRMLMKKESSASATMSAGASGPEAESLMSPGCWSCSDGRQLQERNAASGAKAVAA